jgi:uncharacterized membrane protein (DUF2068 family)
MALRPPAALWWIVAFKALKATALVALGAGLLFARKVPADLSLMRIAAVLHVPLSSRILERALAVATTLTPRREVALGLTAWAYSGLFTVEALGLSRRATWARWLTVVATACLIPLEVYEIARRPTPLRIGALIVNVLVVAYLVRRKDVFESAG